MTKEKWEKDLSPKNRWDVQVALRGPDCHHSDHIKWFSTSIIRAEMAKVIRVGGLVNTTDPGFVVVPSGYFPNISVTFQGKKGEEKVETAPIQFRWDYSHFFQHVMEAASVLDLRVLRVPIEKYFEIINSGGPQYAMLKAFWKESKKDYGDDSDMEKLIEKSVEMLKSGGGY